MNDFIPDNIIIEPSLNDSFIPDDIVIEPSSQVTNLAVQDNFFIPDNIVIESARNDFTPDSMVLESPSFEETKPDSKGYLSLILSFLLLILYFVRMITKLTIISDIFYIVAPVVLVYTLLSIKTLWGRVGGVVFVGAFILNLI